MGFCPLARTKRFGQGVVSEIAKKRDATDGQIMIRWSYQTGVVTIPKSSKEKRIDENARSVEDIELSEEDMKQLHDANDGFHASSATLATNEDWEKVK
tara:strand:+ start:573 stop:866 length:294 start_codon:yes stop_codon:yes gene_type:complete